MQFSLASRLTARRAALHAAAAWLNRNAPEAAAAIVSRAEQALAGRITISGSSDIPFQVGNQPAWKEIRTRDNHYGSDLNRMLHWHDMLKAFLLTGRPAFAEKLVAEALDWINQCPRPPLPATPQERMRNFYSVDATAVPWHCLNSGIRLFESWRRLLETLAGTPHLTPAALEQVAAAMRAQAEAIRGVSPFLFPDAYHNHYLMEMLGVLSYARLFPEMPEAPAWGAEAVKEIGRCVMAQISPDGAQVEACPSYHNGCSYWFCLARQFAADLGLALAPEADERLRRGFDYAVYATRPAGTEAPWGDSHPGTGHVASGILAMNAFADSAILAQAASFTPPEVVRRVCLEKIWDAAEPEKLLDGLGAAIADGRASGRHWPLTNWQRQVKQVSLRTAWTQDAAGVFFAAYSPVHYGLHGHIDPCGFDFCALGTPLLVDPGCCPYFESERRRRTKSATGHNMLTINFREPFDYCSSFGYGPQQEGGIDWVQEAPDLLAVQGFHCNYAPARHRRALALLDGRLLLVLDELTELFWLSSAQLYFQFPFAAVAARPDGPGVLGTAENGVAVTVVPCAQLKLGIPPYRLHPEADAPLVTSVRFDDFGFSQQTVRAYVTLVVPVPAGAPVPAIRAPVVGGSPERRDVTFAIDGTEFALGWLPDRIVCAG